jgi:hypothetical protein
MSVLKLPSKLTELKDVSSAFRTIEREFNLLLESVNKT